MEDVLYNDVFAFPTGKKNLVTKTPVNLGSQYAIIYP